MGAARELRPVSIACDLGRQPRQKMANGADLEGSGHRYGGEFALWYRWPERHGSQNRKDSARCNQKRHGRAQIPRDIGDVGSGALVSEQRRLSPLRLAGAFRAKACRRRVRAQTGLMEPGAQTVKSLRALPG